MPHIQVVKDFVFTDETTKVTTAFKKGTHEVEDHVANHWFVKAHLNGAKPSPAAGTPAFLRHEAQERARLEAEHAKLLADRDAAVTASLREKIEAETAERIKIALEQQAASRVNGQDEIEAAKEAIRAELEAELDQRVEAAKTVMRAEFEAELQARIDKAVEDALEGLIGDETKATEKAPETVPAKAGKTK